MAHPHPYCVEKSVDILVTRSGALVHSSQINLPFVSSSHWPSLLLRMYCLWMFLMKTTVILQLKYGISMIDCSFFVYCAREYVYIVRALRVSLDGTTDETMASYGRQILSMQ